jgi:guanine deaminase
MGMFFGWGFVDRMVRMRNASTSAYAVRGPLLVPGASACGYVADGLIVADGSGRIAYAGAYRDEEAKRALHVRTSEGVMLPPLVDIHTHISQHPIRGRFTEGIAGDPPEGRLLAGLKRNVYPAEARCNDPHVAEQVVRDFLADTLAHGVVGGCAYMTSSFEATRIALSILPDTWRVGMVLMDRPEVIEALRSNPDHARGQMLELTQQFGDRFVATDRFAPVVTTPLRQRASDIATAHALFTQTHLNEQPGEKTLVEDVLYPDYASYTDVYERDGLLDRPCIVAHCVEMRDEEWSILRKTGAIIAHCPTSNLLLGSRRMNLDAAIGHGIPYAIATDVGASPTVSMLAEMGRFLAVHRGQSAHATPGEALYRATLAPAQLLRIDDRVGRLERGAPASFIEVQPAAPADDVDACIRSLIPANLDQPEMRVARVTLDGRSVR